MRKSFNKGLYGRVEVMIMSTMVSVNINLINFVHIMLKCIPKTFNLPPN